MKIEQVNAFSLFSNFIQGIEEIQMNTNGFMRAKGLRKMVFQLGDAKKGKEERKRRKSADDF